MNFVLTPNHCPREQQILRIGENNTPLPIHFSQMCTLTMEWKSGIYRSVPANSHFRCIILLESKNLFLEASFRSLFLHHWWHYFHSSRIYGTFWRDFGCHRWEGIKLTCFGQEPGIFLQSYNAKDNPTTQKCPVQKRYWSYEILL